MTSYTFDQLLDFTRTSSATFVGRNGLVQTTAASRNLLTQTQQFDNAFWTKTAAAVTANTTVAPDGTSTADTLTEDSTAATAHRVFTTVTVAAAAHTASIYVKAGTRSWFYIRLTDSGAVQRYAYFNVGAGTLGTVETNLTASITDAGNGWYRCSATVNVAATSLPVIFAMTTGDNTQIYNGNGTGNTFLWGAQLEAASAATTYTRNNGGVFPPRFDYDPITLAPKGILIEEQRTNLLLRSEEFDNAAWIKSGAAITANSTTSPSGAATADTLTEDTSTGGHITYQSVTVSNATVYTFTVYAKPNGRTLIDLTFAGVGSATYNISTGVVTNTLQGTANIQAAGNGWYRCSITFTSSVTSYNAQIRLVSTGTTTSYAGDGTSGVFLYGAQLEAGAFATSYIPTVASQVTRTADQTSIVAPNFASWYNQNAGTFVFEGTVLTASGFVWPLVASDNTAANRLAMYRSGASVAGFISASSATQMEITSSPVAANVTFKIAVSAQANDGNFSFNGNIGTTDTSITMPLVNRLSLGASASGSAEYLNGYIRSIRYYPTRLTNAQLQALTTL